MKEWVLHCTVNVFDGISTLTSRPTVTANGKDEKEAIAAAKKDIEKRYKSLGCSVNSVSVALIKQIGRESS